MAKKPTEIQKRVSTEMEGVSQPQPEHEEISASVVTEYTPPVDILETVDEYVVIADMPGVEEKNLNVTVENNILNIEGWRDVVQSKEPYSRKTETATWLYRRQFNLVEGIDREKIDASYQNGVLRVVLPKTEDAKPKKIKIK